ncbi:hypothetical protein [Flavobacterium sp. Root186]|uniref:hypothetical protein n=1 Tax=Flavobacterium sp. Root186 TaxID=1736485 RepID=UPI0006F4B3DF|nr:hypothetical protein [Flavobacterium sp. Root186]KRB56933.1 hypothetical protein ASD98_09655 [Flavobacterium sp. Root186]
MNKKFLTAIIVLLFGICFSFTSCKEKDKNEIKITESQALEIAKRYGISGDNLEIFFNTYTYSKTSLGYQRGKRKLFYWDVSKKCNNCSAIQIDAVTGNVFSEIKYKYVY